MNTLGIDVSRWNGKIDWQKVKDAGYSFAFIRTNDGGTLDKTFDENIKNARKAGLMVGSYFYYRFRADKKDILPQVELSCNMLRQAVGIDVNGNLPPGILPPVIDVEEDNKLTLSEKEKSDQLIMSLEKMREITKLAPIIYTFPSYWNTNFKTTTADKFSKYPLWIAHVTKAKEPMKITGWTDWLVWQYSHTGSVPGVSSKDTDLNIWNGSLDDLKWFCRFD